MKACSACGLEKPDTEYYKATAIKGGLQSWCKSCVKAHRELPEVKASRKLYAQTPKAKAAALAYHQTPEWKARHREWYLINYYGISTEQYNTLWTAQGGCCAICGLPQDKESNRLAVDHNHTTGEVRGLLCFACNQAIGLFKDRPEVLERAGWYLGGYQMNKKDKINVQG